MSQNPTVLRRMIQEERPFDDIRKMPLELFEAADDAFCIWPSNGS
jgi:hypothetical protein